jgi:hypothetical protein
MVHTEPGSSESVRIRILEAGYENHSNELNEHEEELDDHEARITALEKLLVKKT